LYNLSVEEDESYIARGMVVHNCRCFPEFVTKTFREMGVDVDEIEKAYRPYTVRGTVDPLTGKVIPGKIGVGGGKIIETGRFLGTYEDFLKGQSEKVQRQILGPGRLELWKSGKVKLKDFADAKGNQYLLTELRGVKAVLRLGKINIGGKGKSALAIEKEYGVSKDAAVIRDKMEDVLKRDVSIELSKRMDRLDLPEWRELQSTLHRTSEETASYLIQQWSVTSGDTNPQSIMMQLAAKKEFNLNGTSIWWEKEALEKATKGLQKYETVMRKFLREMHNNTQDYLKKKGIKSIRVARGYKGNIGISDATVANPMGKVTTQLQPMSSFSSDLSIAQGFSTPRAVGGAQSSVFFAEVSIDRVLSCPVTGYGCRHEYEWIVLGAQEKGGEAMLATTFDSDKIRAGLFDIFGVTQDSDAFPNLMKKITNAIVRESK